MVVSVECVQKSEHEEINMLSVIITAAFLYFLGFPFSRQNIFLMSVRHRKFGWLKKIIIISWNRIHVQHPMLQNKRFKCGEQHDCRNVEYFTAHPLM
jgi:hypothetical protein